VVSPGNNITLWNVSIDVSGGFAVGDGGTLTIIRHTPGETITTGPSCASFQFFHLFIENLFHFIGELAMSANSELVIVDYLSEGPVMVITSCPRVAEATLTVRLPADRQTSLGRGISAPLIKYNCTSSPFKSTQIMAEEAAGSCLQQDSIKFTTTADMTLVVLFDLSETCSVISSSYMSPPFSLLLCLLLLLVLSLSLPWDR